MTHLVLYLDFILVSIFQAIKMIANITEGMAPNLEISILYIKINYK